MLRVQPSVTLAGYPTSVEAAAISTGVVADTKPARLDGGGEKVLRTMGGAVARI